MISISVLFVNSNYGQSYLMNYITKAAREELGLVIEVTNPKIHMPLIATIDALTFSDAVGQIARLEQVEISVAPYSLLFRNIQFDHVTIGKIHIAKKDVKLNLQRTDASTSVFFNSLILSKIDIGNVQIGGESFALNAHGIIKDAMNIAEFSARLDYLNSQYSSLPNSTLRLSGGYNFATELLNMEQLSVQGENLNVQGSLMSNFQSKELEGSLQYNFNFIQEQDLPANINGNLKIQGTLEAPKIIIDNKFTHPKFTNGECLSCEGEIDISSGNAAAHVNLNNDLAQISALLKYKGNRINIESLNIIFENIKAAGAIALDLDKMLAFGNVKITLDPILTDSSIVDFMPQKMHLGSGRGNIEVALGATDMKTQQLSVKGFLREYQLGDIILEKIEGDLLFADIYSLKLGKTAISLKNAAMGTLQVENFLIACDNPGSDIRYSGIVKASDPLYLKVIFSGRVANLLDKQLSGAVDSMNGTMGRARFSLKKPSAFHYAHGEFSLKGSSNMGTGSADYDILLAQERLKGQMNFSNMPTTILYGILSSNFPTGRINGQVTLKGSGAEPLLESKVNITELASAKNSSAAQIKAHTMLDHKNLKLQMDIIGPKQANIGIVRAQVPQIFSLAPVRYEILSQQPFSGSIHLYDKFDLLSLLPIAQSHKISGFCHGRMEAKGTLVQPVISGTLNLHDGRYSYKSQNVRFMDIAAVIRAEGKRLVIDKITGKDAYGNKVQGNVYAELAKNNDFVVNLSSDYVRPMDAPYATGAIAAKLHIAGDVNSSLVTGNILLKDVKITIPEEIDRYIPELNIVNLPKATATSNYMEYPLKFDVHVDTGENVLVTGWGVDAKLAGSLDIRGDINQPLIFGQLRTTRGQYEEFGKLLNIKSGILDFKGPITPSPFLNITGVTQTADAEIRVILSGPVNKLEIFIESTPAMAQDKALALLLFGKNPESLAVVQLIQLADSARRLSGQGKKTTLNPFSIGKKLLRVDNLNIKTNDANPNQNAISVGKYLSDKVYLEVESGQQSAAKTKVEIQLTPKLSIDNSINTEGANTIGVNWRLDY